jgi:hypothetical protein
MGFGRARFRSWRSIASRVILRNSGKILDAGGGAYGLGVIYAKTVLHGSEAGKAA